MKISTQRIKRLMGENLMNQLNLAEAAGVSRATVNSTLLKGSCSVATAGKIAEALKVTPSEIIEREC